jgi:hypothetical protein
MPGDDLFRVIDETLLGGSPGEALDLLIEEFRRTHRYDLLFEAKRMRKRLDLGLPLIETEALSCSAEERAAYGEASVEAAREAGLLCLDDGQIAAGYRYLRAIGEIAPVADAISEVDPNDEVGEEVVAIALQEGVHPVKGLELILRKHGMCRAITAFGMCAVDKDRDRCIALLVRELHAEVASRMGFAIEQREGVRPGTSSLSELIAGREWMFGEYDYYVDTSHLTSVIPYCLEVSDEEVLRLLGELCCYGERLSPMFAFKGQPPFEDGYAGYGRYVKALRGIEVDEQVRYFRQKAVDADPEFAGSAPAQQLVTLLARLGRFDAALEVWLEFLANEEPAYLRCPSPLDLCYRSGNFERLRELARERSDVLTYTAASALRSGAASGTSK